MVAIICKAHRTMLPIISHAHSRTSYNTTMDDDTLSVTLADCIENISDTKKRTLINANVDCVCLRVSEREKEQRLQQQ